MITVVYISSGKKRLCKKTTIRKNQLISLVAKTFKHTPYRKFLRWFGSCQVEPYSTVADDDYSEAALLLEWSLF